jgi:hypothetical protein
MITKTLAPSTRKVRRDVVGGKRGDGHQRLYCPRSRPDCRGIRVAATSERLTDVAGLVGFGQFLSERGVDGELKRFARLKSGLAVVYEMPDQIRLFIDAQLAGESRVLGLEALAADPLFVRLAGGCVPSIDTLYRDLRRFDQAAVDDLESMVFRQGLDGRALPRRGDVHLDIDSTVEPLFGRHEGGAVGPNPRYHGRPSYHPLVARCAETDTCVGAQLRHGDTAFGGDDAPFVRRVVERFRGTLRKGHRLVVRIDAAGDCDAILRAIRDAGAHFVIKGHATRDLLAAVRAHTSWKTVDRDAFDKPVTQVADVAFARGVWKESGLQVRVIAVRTKEPGAGKQLVLWEDQDWCVKLYFTSLPDPVEDLVRSYDGRAGIEPRIAEWKNGWGIGDVPCFEFLANHAMFLLKLLAHNLLRAFVAARLPALVGWTAQWLRKLLVRTAGKLVCSGRCWTLLVSRTSPLLRLLS